MRKDKRGKNLLFCIRPLAGTDEWLGEEREIGRATQKCVLSILAANTLKQPCDIHFSRRSLHSFRFSSDRVSYHWICASPVITRCVRCSFLPPGDLSLSSRVRACVRACRGIRHSGASNRSAYSSPHYHSFGGIHSCKERKTGEKKKSGGVIFAHRSPLISNSLKQKWLKSCRHGAATTFALLLHRWRCYWVRNGFRFFSTVGFFPRCVFLGHSFTLCVSLSFFSGVKIVTELVCV